MTDGECMNHFSLQMKCKELYGQKLSFTTPHSLNGVFFPSTGI